MPFQPFDPGREVHTHRDHLPHWRQWGTTYFITSRLADSVPVVIARQWQQRRQAWLASHNLASAQELDRLPEKKRHEYHREFTARFHELLDAGHGLCVLRQSGCADILTAKLHAGHGREYWLDSWVIMPNHLHALVEPAEGVDLGRILQRWKGGSAREINLHLARAGKLWQHESYDHIVRSEEQLNHYRRYIAQNPEKAHLKGGYVLGVGRKSSKKLWFAPSNFS
jgi:REP element-mobilizing transposase RayT